MLKKLQAVVDITNYLSDHSFTYNETNELLTMLQSEISSSRELNEYKTVKNYFNRIPSCDIGSKIITPLNNVDVKELLLEDISYSTLSQSKNQDIEVSE